PVTWLLCHGAKCRVQPSEAFGKLVLGTWEVQDPGHLVGGLAARPGVGHRQGGRDAAGREKQVPRLVPQLAVKIHGELAVTLGNTGHATLLRTRHGSDCGRRQKKQNRLLDVTHQMFPPAFDLCYVYFTSLEATSASPDSP